MNKNYEWKRYWCLRGGEIKLSDSGFLYSPELGYSKYYPQNVNILEEIVNIPCLVLLGESGIGKTSELKRSINSHKEILRLNDEQIHYHELNQYSNGSCFIKGIFNNKNFHVAQQNNLNYVLLLDGLDECKTGIDTISEILANELKENYWSNLYLRITCRTAEWSKFLENTIIETYGGKRVKFYELAPLRKNDVVLALKENEIEEEKFFEEIYQKALQPLVIKPITLNFLINSYKNHKNLPSSHREIYEEGLKLLINQQNISGKESKILRKYPDSYKLFVAQRIAAMMMLDYKTNITLEINGQVDYDTDVFIDELCGIEIINNEKVEIPKDLVKETLNTGLFVSNDKEMFRWYHQSFAEYLTARYLWIKEVSETQIFKLLFQNFNGKLKLIPQLNETIGWLISFRPELFNKILKDDIQLFFNSDVLLQDEKSKEKFTSQLLKLFEEKEIYDVYHSFTKSYHKLKHANIESQIRKIINDKTKNETTRYEAINIAESCRLESLLNDINDIFQNKQESILVRQNAGRVIKNFGNEFYIKKMKSVLLGDLSEDLDDELKGICLLSLWPNFLTYEELFSVLDKRKRPNFGGNYMIFLYNCNLPNSNNEDLIVALKWISKQESKHNLDLHGISEIMDNIMFTAFNYLDDESVLEEYKNAVISLIKNYDDIVGSKLKEKFYKNFEEKDEKRRKLIKMIVQYMSNPEKQINYFLHPDMPLAYKKDFPWLLEQAICEPDQSKSRALLNLAMYFFDITNSDHLDNIIIFSEKNPIICDEFGYYLNSFELNSEETKKKL